MRVAQGGQDARQQVGADRRDDAEAQAAGERFAGRAGRVDQVADVAEDGAGARRHLGAERRQHDGAPGALDQRRAEQALEVLEARAERRLGDETGIRRLAEVELIGERDEITQLARRGQGGHRSLIENNDV